jgi:hypothetical protein
MTGVELWSVDQLVTGEFGDGLLSVYVMLAIPVGWLTFGCSTLVARIGSAARRVPLGDRV